MTLVKYKTQHPSLLDGFFKNEIDHWARRNFSTTNTTIPSINIKENLDGFEVEVAAPGFEKKDFNIELNNEVLTISSERVHDNVEDENEKYTTKEYSYESFSRSFTLPKLIEGDKITANYKNGILHVVIPKKEEAKPQPVKQIAVK